MNERDVTNANIKSTIKDKTKDSRKHHVKAAGLIRSRVRQQHCQFIANMTAEDMWTTLKEKLQDTTSISQMEVILKASDIKMSSYADPASYCAEFKSIYNKAISMIQNPKNGELEFTAKVTEIFLQAAMLRNSGKAYKALVSQIRKGWKLGNTVTTENTNLTETCNNIIRYKATRQTSKALITATKRKKPAKGSCTAKECIKAKLTRHLPDACWIKYPT